MTFSHDFLIIIDNLAGDGSGAEKKNLERKKTMTTETILLTRAEAINRASDIFRMLSEATYRNEDGKFQPIHPSMEMMNDAVVVKVYNDLAIIPASMKLGDTNSLSELRPEQVEIMRLDNGTCILRVEIPFGASPF